MFSKVAIIMTATMAALVVAGDSEIKNSCNGGSMHCCNSKFESKSEASNWLHELVGATVDPISGQAGLNCSPITGIGAGSGVQCNQQPVCCSGNHMKGLIVVGCSPINVNA